MSAWPPALLYAVVMFGVAVFALPTALAARRAARNGAPRLLVRGFDPLPTFREEIARPFADVMTHVGQPALLRRRADRPGRTRELHLCRHTIRSAGERPGAARPSRPTLAGTSRRGSYPTLSHGPGR
ncbi:MAG TPA: hypothetical protein VGA78_02255 [Gemmatimonadales bacterium]